jgi:hypothetical protein
VPRRCVYNVAGGASCSPLALSSLVFGRSPDTCCFLFPVTSPVSCNCDASCMNQDVGLTYLKHRAQHPLFGTMKAEHQRARPADTVNSAVVCRAIVTISTSTHGNKHNASHVYKQSHQSRYKHRNHGRLLAAPERRPTTLNHNDGNPNSPCVCATTTFHGCKLRILTTRSLLFPLSLKTMTRINLHATKVYHNNETSARASLSRIRYLHDHTLARSSMFLPLP